MNINDKVEISYGGQIIKSKITYTDKEKSCGYVKISSIERYNGTIIGYKSGWFRNYWIVALDNGKIVNVAA